MSDTRANYGQWRRCASQTLSDDWAMHASPRSTIGLLEQLAASLRESPPSAAALDGDPARAAVALTFRADRHEPEFLLIRRAAREGDPWSGQIALPGGRYEPHDRSLADTAIRETFEETGIDLSAEGAIVGTLDELRPRTPTLPPIIVTPHVALVTPPPALTLSHEVAHAFWVPWRALTEPSNVRESEVAVRGASLRVPSFVIDGHIVWGMTERILRSMLVRVSR